MNKVVAVQPKKTVRQRVSQGLAVATGTALAVPAMAMPTAETITAPIEATSALVDSTGGSLISVIVGMVAFGLIIGMLMRKGK